MNELYRRSNITRYKVRGLFNFDVVSKIWNKREKNEFSKGDVKNFMDVLFFQRLGHKLS